MLYFGHGIPARLLDKETTYAEAGGAVSLGGSAGGRALGRGVASAAEAVLVRDAGVVLCSKIGEKRFSMKETSTIDTKGYRKE